MSQSKMKVFVINISKLLGFCQYFQWEIKVSGTTKQKNIVKYVQEKFNLEILNNVFLEEDDGNLIYCL